MQFEPIATDFDPSLYTFNDQLRIHGSRKFNRLNNNSIIYGANNTSINSPNTKTFKTIIIPLIISGIVFLTILAIYDTVRSCISNYYSKKALIDPLAKNSIDTINRTLIANYYHLISSFVYTIFCIIVLLIALYLYFKS